MSEPPDLDRLIKSAQERLQRIQAQTNSSGEHNQLAEAIAELSVTLAELQVANQELHPEAEHEQAQILLRQQEQAYRALVENSPDIIERFDTHFRHLYVSPVLEEVIGIPSAQLLGKTCREVGLPESMVDLWETAARTLLVTRETQAIEFETPTTKGIRCFEMRIAPEIDREGAIASILCISRDITDRKATETQLQQAHQELICANRLKDEFLANMSHELRTPLTAILGMTEGLMNKSFGDVIPEQLQILQSIENSGSHLLGMINDILDLTNIESEQLDLNRATVAVEPLCRASLATIQPQASAKDIQLNLQLPPHLPDLFVDERYISKVLINLLDNAVKFTPDGGRISLEVSCLPQSPTPSLHPPHLRIAIIDTGIGIAPEQIEKLFQPFIQIDSSLNRKYKGTGLGLALVRMIVELHGGYVGVTSEVGVGSCFEITLPYENIVSSPSILPAGVIDNELFPSIQLPPLILLAEDNEATISTTSSYLKAKGYRLLVARNGLEAIALAQSERPNLILMDVQMPEMDGLEAMRQIRQNPRLAGVPMIAVTALAMKGDRERCLAAGADDYVSKPIKLKQLLFMMQQLLSNQL